MTGPDRLPTRWSVIRDAAAGNEVARAIFAERYQPLVRAYLGARWRNSSHANDVDDAAQDVFLDCLRESGALTRADSEAPGGFRAFLHGVTRNVARRVEDRRRRDRARGSDVSPEDLEGREESASRLYEQAWAKSLMSQASALLEERAGHSGAEAVARAELLRLRFESDMPIREIAERRKTDAARLHHDYALARREFHEALRDVVREQEGGSDADVERECARLLDSLA